MWCCLLNKSPILEGEVGLVCTSLYTHDEIYNRTSMKCFGLHVEDITNGRIYYFPSIRKKKI